LYHLQERDPSSAGEPADDDDASQPGTPRATTPPPKKVEATETKEQEQDEWADVAGTVEVRAAMQKWRIVRLGFGTS
jgi:hypothetical protein